VIDDVVGAEGMDLRALVRAARGRDDPAPEQLRDLDRGAPTPEPPASTSTVSPARTIARDASIDHAVMNTSGNAAACSKRQRGRLGRDRALGQHDELLAAPVAGLAEDLVAHAQVVAAERARLAQSRTRRSGSR
jgi:hypothetical protein